MQTYDAPRSPVSVANMGVLCQEMENKIPMLCAQLSVFAGRVPQTYNHVITANNTVFTEDTTVRASWLQVFQLSLPRFFGVRVFLTGFSISANRELKSRVWDSRPCALLPHCPETHNLKFFPYSGHPSILGACAEGLCKGHCAGGAQPGVQQGRQGQGQGQRARAKASPGPLQTRSSTRRAARARRAWAWTRARTRAKSPRPKASPGPLQTRSSTHSPRDSCVSSERIGITTKPQQCDRNRRAARARRAARGCQKSYHRDTCFWCPSIVRLLFDLSMARRHEKSRITGARDP